MNKTANLFRLILLEWLRPGASNPKYLPLPKGQIF